MHKPIFVPALCLPVVANFVSSENLYGIFSSDAFK